MRPTWNGLTTVLYSPGQRFDYFEADRIVLGCPQGGWQIAERVLHELRGDGQVPSVFADHLTMRSQIRVLAAMRLAEVVFEQSTVEDSESWRVTKYKYADREVLSRTYPSLRAAWDAVAKAVSRDRPRNSP